MDLAPLSSCQELVSLSLDNTKVRNLAPLESAASLRFLDMKDTDVVAISPLQDLKLNRTTLDLSKVENWRDVLRNIKTLEWINDTHVNKFWKTH